MRHIAKDKYMYTGLLSASMLFCALVPESQAWDCAAWAIMSFAIAIPLLAGLVVASFIVERDRRDALSKFPTLYVVSAIVTSGVGIGLTFYSLKSAAGVLFTASLFIALYYLNKTPWIEERTYVEQPEQQDTQSG